MSAPTLSSSIRDVVSDVGSLGGLLLDVGEFCESTEREYFTRHPTPPKSGALRRLRKIIKKESVAYFREHGGGSRRLRIFPHLRCFLRASEGDVTCDAVDVANHGQEPSSLVAAKRSLRGNDDGGPDGTSNPPQEPDDTAAASGREFVEVTRGMANRLRFPFEAELATVVCVSHLAALKAGTWAAPAVPFTAERLATVRKFEPPLRDEQATETSSSSSGEEGLILRGASPNPSPPRLSAKRRKTVETYVATPPRSAAKAKTSTTQATKKRKGKTKGNNRKRTASAAASGVADGAVNRPRMRKRIRAGVRGKTLAAIVEQQLADGDDGEDGDDVIGCVRSGPVHIECQRYMDLRLLAVQARHQAELVKLEDEYDRRLSALTAALERKDMLLTALYDQTIVARLNGASKGGS